MYCVMSWWSSWTGGGSCPCLGPSVSGPEYYYHHSSSIPLALWLSCALGKERVIGWLRQLLEFQAQKVKVQMWLAFHLCSSRVGILQLQPALWKCMDEESRSNVGLSAPGDEGENSIGGTRTTGTRSHSVVCWCSFHCDVNGPYFMFLYVVFTV